MKLLSLKLFLVSLSITVLLLGPVQAAHHGGGEMSFKERLNKTGKKPNTVRVPTDANREEVHALIKEHKPEMLYLDAHHAPCTEWDVSRIVKAAQELDTPVMMRIDHADQAGLISSILDLGVFSIKVPTVEDEETVQKIIDGFYYPPLGKRSLGGANNYGERDKNGKKMATIDGMSYPEWWNKNAILGCKLETLKGVLNARFLAMPGVDYFDFGGQDLQHDLNIQKHPGFEKLADCREFVINALEGTGTRF